MRTLLGLPRTLRAAGVIAAFAFVVGFGSAQFAPNLTGDQARSIKERLRESGKSFTENKGQWDQDAKFLSRESGLNVWITRNGWRLDSYRVLGDKENARQVGHVLDFTFPGSSRNVNVFGTDQRRLRTDFLQGKKAVRGVRSYGEVWLQNLYRGIDARWYRDGGKPRFDFVVAPGADPSTIRMRVGGANGLRIAANGDLCIKTSLGELVQADLVAYQVENGKRTPVDADFKVLDSRTVGFTVRNYDRSRTLVIDPLVYGSYYGGDGGWDEVQSVVADSDFGVYITGYTQAPDFPAIMGPYGFNLSGTRDAFVSKFQGDAYNHDYSAYIGGSGSDTGQFVALSPDGNKVWACGTTTSANFPGINGNSLFGARSGSSDIFIIRFSKDQNSVLIPDYSTYYGTASQEVLAGFSVAPVTGQPVVVGVTDGGLPSTSNGYLGGSQDAFITRFTVNAVGINGIAWSYYVGGVGADFCAGVATDANDNAVMTGTVSANGNVDTSVDPSRYDTTPGVFENGRLLRNADAYIRKYNASGTVVFSALLGGNDDDSSAGVTVDNVGNVYVTGVAASFNFPRTRGVYGENFTAANVVFCTKITPDASAITYSTHLRTNGPVIPKGVAVDTRGIAYITGVVDFTLTFPNPPADPNEPNGVNFGSVPITPDALDPDYESPQPAELPTTEAFVLALTPTASNLLYGSYIGGLLDENCFAPYVDRFGDVWICGSTDSLRFYQRVGTSTTVTYLTQASLPAALVSPFAFKTTGDAFGGQVQNGVPYGIKESPFTSPQFINGVTYQRDGFIIKKRLSLPTIASLVLNPPAIAGGLGASTVGTITLSGPVPAGGLDITVTLNNAAASFSPSAPQNTLTISLAAGATNAQFTVFSNPVTDPTQVQVRATLEGNFQIALLTVQPWLQQLTITPTSVVGGNLATGRIRLWQAAITDITVDLATDTSGLVEFPGGSTVTVPAGVDTVTFPIQTHGVDSATPVPVTASLLGVGKTEFLTLLTASLATVTFNPARVTSGTSSTGTVTLNGEAGPNGFTVDLILGPGTPGYTIVSTPLTFAGGDRSKTFVINTVFEPVNTQRTVTASRSAQGAYPAQSINGVLFVDAASLISFTVSQTQMNPGSTITGTVTISVPAGTGGANVGITSDNPLVTVPANAVIPAGATSTTFNITAANQALINDVVVTITATRGPVSIQRQVTVRASQATLALNPTSVVGGDTSQGTVTIAAPAGPGGVTFALSSNNPAATVPGSVTINQGQSSATFQVTTSLVASNTIATITATAGSISAQANLEIRAVGVASLLFIPARTRGGMSVQMRVTLDAPAPPGDAVVAITHTNFLVATIPGSVTVPAGQTSRTVTILTKRVSRTLQTVATANLGSTLKSASLTVTR